MLASLMTLCNARIVHEGHILTWLGIGSYNIIF